jgi:predicted aspartyl protease
MPDMVAAFMATARSYLLDRALIWINAPSQIAPIQMWIAADPSDRDTTQARALISGYAKKGACNLNYAKGSDRFFTQGSDVIKAKVEINGISGIFIIDTGASLVSLTPNFAKRAKVGLDESRAPRTMTILLLEISPLWHDARFHC